MLAFVLRRLRASAVFLGLFDRLTKVAVRQSLVLFSSGQHGVRVQSVLLMRQLAALHGRPTLDMVLKVWWGFGDDVLPSVVAQRR